jgi:outer membrane biosynthesis protein TonB
LIESPQDLHGDIALGTGTASCSARTDSDTVGAPLLRPGRILIVSKPKAQYTVEAREQNIEGSVILKVQFLASGRIGAIMPIRTLPLGLTDSAIEAAKRIEFTPEKDTKGRAIAVVRTVEYPFEIY